MVTKSDWQQLLEVADLVAPGLLHGVEPLAESRHFYTCNYCDQAVDRRVPVDVRHHARPGHSPRPRG